MPPEISDSLLRRFSSARTWWAEGHPLVSRWTHTKDGMDLTWVAHAANAYHRWTRWVRPGFWAYIWQAPERFVGRPPYKRAWRDLNPWEVRWCRLRGHPGIIFYNAGGSEPDGRCKRCLEEIA